MYKLSPTSVQLADNTQKILESCFERPRATQLVGATITMLTISLGLSMQKISYRDAGGKPRLMHYYIYSLSWRNYDFTLNLSSCPNDGYDTLASRI